MQLSKKSLTFPRRYATMSALIEERLNISTFSPMVKARNFYAKKTREERKGYRRRSATISEFALGIRENIRMTVTVGEVLFSQKRIFFDLR